jgi:hypothetical protein
MYFIKIYYFQNFSIKYIFQKYKNSYVGLYLHIINIFLFIIFIKIDMYSTWTLRILFRAKTQKTCLKYIFILKSYFPLFFLYYLTNTYQFLRLCSFQLNIARIGTQALEKAVKASSKPLSWCFLKGTGFSCWFSHENTSVQDNRPLDQACKTGHHNLETTWIATFDATPSHQMLKLMKLCWKTEEPNIFHPIKYVQNPVYLFWSHRDIR